MKTVICVLLALAGFAIGPASAQQPFVHRPHYIHERQLIPERTPTFDQYYLRKYGRLPPYSRIRIAPSEPAMPPGYRWSDVYVPGYGYVPTDLLID